MNDAVEIKPELDTRHGRTISGIGNTAERNVDDKLIILHPLQLGISK